MSVVRVIEKKHYWYLVNPVASVCGRDMLMIPRGEGWTFEGTVEFPSFSPSVREEGKTPRVDEDGNDLTPLPYCNHYIVTGGKIQFCDDSTHQISGQTVELPAFSEEEIARYGGDNW